MKPIVVGGALAIALLSATCGDAGGGGAASGSPATGREVSGTFTLNEGLDTEYDPTLGAFEKPENGTLCWGAEGYDDIAEGVAVVVRDENGTTVATGRLGPGRYSRAEGDCVFEFTVEEVPDAAFYSIEVSHRGEVTYSADELEDAGWSVELTLGEEP